jgi:cytochrome c oxidase cbb3-type subunit 1
LGIPASAPVPAWLPTTSTLAAILLIIPILAVAVIFVRTVWGVKTSCKGGPFCYIKFGTVAFLLSGLMLIAPVCPHLNRATELTWFGTAQTIWQIIGFFSIVIIGAIYELLPRVMGFGLPFPKFIRLQHWLFMLGSAILLVTFAVAGIAQAGNDFKLEAALPFLRVTTVGWLLLLAGSLLLAANIFVMTFKWKCGLLKTGFNAVTAPLETSPSGPGVWRGQGEVDP